MLNQTEPIEREIREFSCFDSAPENDGWGWNRNERGQYEEEEIPDEVDFDREDYDFREVYGNN